MSKPLNRILPALLLAFLPPAAQADDASDCRNLMQAERYRAAHPACKRAAEQGDTLSQYALGIMHEHGDGTRQDYSEAAKWYHKAAEQGYASAQFNLALMYDQGRGVAQNHRESAKWSYKAAAQGHPVAQAKMGAAYYLGTGVKADKQEAYIWLLLASRQEAAGAREALALAGRELSPEQIAAAQKEAARRFDIIERSKRKIE